MEDIDNGQHYFKLKTCNRSPVTVERLNRREEITDQSLSYSLVNFRLISVQRMDAVLHLVQRKLIKQKEQQIFGNFMQMYNMSSFDATTGSANMEESVRDIAKSHNNTKRLSNKGVQTVEVNNRRQTAGNCYSVTHFNKTATNLKDEVTAVKNLAEELTSCIKKLHLVLKQEMQPASFASRISTYDKSPARLIKEKMQSHRRKPESKIEQLSRVSASAKPYLNGKPRALYRSFEKKDAQLPSGAKLHCQHNNRNRLTRQTFKKSRLPRHAEEQNKADYDTLKFDFTTMLQQLEDIEKIEEGVRQNLHSIKLDSISTTATENLNEIGNANIVTYHKFPNYVTDCMNTSAPSSPNQCLLSNLPKRTMLTSNSSKYLPVSSVFQFCDMETRQLAEQLTSSLANDLTYGSPRDISGLPDEFLKELFEKEFAS